MTLELFVVWFIECSEVVAEEVKSLLKEWVEAFLGGFGEGSEGGHCILLDDGDTSLDQVRQLWNCLLNVLGGNFCIGTFNEVSKSSAGMSLYSWDGVVQSLE